MKAIMNPSLLTLFFSMLLLPISIVAASEKGKIERMPSSPGAKVYIISPKNGEKVKSPVTVVFGLKNMGIAPAGVKMKGTGHHHLLLDTTFAKIKNKGLPINADKQHIHYGGGQTQTEIELAPGKHTLQLVFGDHLHIPHSPPVFSKSIEIEVEK